MASPAHTSDGHSSRASSGHRGRKFMNITVNFLDDTCHVFQLQAKNLGQVLFDKVCKYLNLIEVDYFGLEFEDDKKTRCWLDVLKPLCVQISNSFPTMYFCVKFYTPDPVQLEDELTRYIFALQIKKDLFGGFLQCNDNTAAVLVSYIVQADFGDYTPEKCSDGSYLASYKFVPQQDSELEKKIIENHKKIVGQTPAEADLNLLETGRRCELYGVKMAAAKDHEGVPLNLAVAHLGVIVFQNYTKINTFSWAKIRKLSFKRKKFLIKLHPEGYGYYKDVVEFFFEGRNESKNFWKKCIENHTFFRCSDAKQGMRQKPKIFKRGSSFRYSGRTQKQVSDFVRENSFNRQPFQRSTSLRSPSSPTRSITAISPQPILPVTSQSCGSISDISNDVVQSQPKTQSASEPTTPHNNNTSANDATAPGLVSSPECETPDFYTDDNVSHDSYNILDRESNDPSAAHTTTSTNSNLDGGATNVASNGASGGGGTSTIREEADSKVNDNLENNNYILREKDLGLSNNNARDAVVNNQNIANGTSPVDNGNSESESAPSPISVKAYFKHNSAQQNTLPNVESSNRLSGESKSDDDPKSPSLSSVIESYSRSNSDQNLIKDLSNLLNGSSTFYVSSPFASNLSNKKKALTDKSYCLAKELLMTERTFRKDLEVVNVVFRDEFSNQNEIKSSAVDLILVTIDPLHEMHCSLLRELEQRLAFWEGKPANQNAIGIKGVADILLMYKRIIPLHSAYLDKLPSILDLLHRDLQGSQRLMRFYQKFEAQKSCYLPLTSLLTRPVFRLLYYSSFVSDLLESYNDQHVDYSNCKEMFEALKKPTESFERRVSNLVNQVKLMELQRSLLGFPNLIVEDREFVREGCLYKFTKNGSNQHMFFLFSDILLYTIRIHDGQLRFKVQGQLPTCDLKVEESQSRLGVSHCFTLCSSKKHLSVSAPSTKELAKWFADVKKSSHAARSKKSSPSENASPHSISEHLLEEKLQDSGDDDADDTLPMIQSRERPVSNMNGSVHICWHRNLSISLNDLLQAMKHNISGYLLRKFKSNSGWQKVWVVLANLCLFFYRSYLDDSPLASLPLAGYKILLTSSSDLVSGDCIFKLMFKNHEYFFMVENKYTFDRWMDAVHMCTLMEDENTRL